MSRLGERYDVVVAGARVAGSAVALLLARAGMRVLVVDPARKGSDTLSTHALMRGAVLQLNRWGVLDRIVAAGTPLIDTTTFYYGDETIEVRIKARDGIEGLYAPRRTVLDAALADAATEAGAQVVFGAALTDVVRDRDGRVRGATVRDVDGSWKTVAADLVVGADGLRSRVARLVDAPITYGVPHSTASVYAHVPGIELSGYHWFYGERLAMGVIPTNDGDACVFASVAPLTFDAERHRGLDTLFNDIVGALSSHVAGRVAGAPHPLHHRGFAGAASFLRKPAGPGWALVGDAGYFKDPLTAHGITDALRDAELLSRTALVGTDDAWAGYEATRDELSRPLLDVTSEIASFAWSIDEVKELHLTLARAMSAEVEMILGWEESQPADTRGRAVPVG